MDDSVERKYEARWNVAGNFDKVIKQYVYIILFYVISLIFNEIYTTVNKFPDSVTIKYFQFSLNPFLCRFFCCPGYADE